MPQDQALDHMAGFVAYNVSYRKWQAILPMREAFPSGASAKGFDKFAVLGPILVSLGMEGNACNLKL